MQGGHRQRESPTFGFLVNEMSSHRSHSKIFISFLSLMSPSLCLFALTSIRQMMRERESPNRASMGGHTRRREFKGKNWTLTQTHTSGLWYPNMSVCNTNIPLWHTAQCVCACVQRVWIYDSRVNAQRWQTLLYMERAVEQKKATNF